MALNEINEFLRIEYFTISWNASVQRNSIYKRNITKLEKEKLKSFVYKYIYSNFLKQYENAISEEKHNENIVKIKNYINSYSKRNNNKVVYKISSAQKFINVLLKFLWISGYIVEPPHCPIDRIIIKKLKKDDRIKWTEINNIRIYKNIIEKIRVIANEKTLAQWELEEYNDSIKY